MWPKNCVFTYSLGLEVILLACDSFFCFCFFWGGGWGVVGNNENGLKTKSYERSDLSRLTHKRGSSCKTLTSSPRTSFKLTWSHQWIITHRPPLKSTSEPIRHQKLTGSYVRALYDLRCVVVT